MKAITEIKSATLKGCCEAFQSNLNRTGFFQMLPTEVSFQVRRDTIWQCNAINLVTGRQFSHITQILEHVPDAATQQAINVQFEQLEKEPESIQFKLRDEMGIKYVESMLKINDGMRHSVDSMFATIIMESWTAFEVLMGDLWCAGVDNGPPANASAVLISSKLHKGEDNLSMEKLRGFEFNAKDNPGSFLREAEKVSFSKIHTAMSFYGLAFGSSASRLFDSTADGKIFALSSFRNVLTHNSGIADAKFVKSMQRFAEHRNIKPKDKIFLDGELVRDLRIAALELGNKLIHLVDDIISPPAT